MRLGWTTIVYFASQVLKSLAGFVATFLIARELGAGVLGIYAVVVATVFWINLPVTAVSQAVNKRVSEGTDQGAFLTAGFGLNAVLAIGITFGIVALSPYVNAYVGKPIAPLLAVLFVAVTLFGTVTSALNGQKRVDKTGVTQVMERVLRTGFQVAVILLGYEVAGLVVGHAASMVIGASIGLLWFRVRPSRPTREHVKKLLAYARYSWLSSLKGRSFSWMDTVVLALFVPSALIGVYEVSWTLASMFALVGISVRQTLFPEVSDLGVDDQYDRIHHYLNEGLVFLGVFAIPGLFGAAVLGTRILKIYSPEFTQGAVVLLILIGARLLGTYSEQFLSAINGIDRPDVAFRINMVFVAVNLVLNVGLVYQFGWYGAAVATVASTGLALVLSYAALASLIGRPDVPYREIANEVFSGVVMAVFVVGIESVFPRNHYATVALVAVGAVVYVVTLLAISSRIRTKIISLFPGSVGTLPG